MPLRAHPGVGHEVDVVAKGRPQGLDHRRIVIGIPAEHRSIVEIVVEASAGRVPVVAGTGSNNTREAVELTRHARDAGAQGALLISPYYNKPTQEGIIAHYRTVADEVGLPDAVINNAGGQFPGQAIDFSPNGWNAVVQNNLNGSWFMMQRAARGWRDAGRGGVIVRCGGVIGGVRDHVHRCHRFRIVPGIGRGLRELTSLVVYRGKREICPEK